MRIGILTYHCADNYGAVLQAYATQRFLLQHGLDVEIINYRPEYLTRDIPYLLKERITKKEFLSFFRLLIALPLLLPWRLARKRRFSQFRKKHMNISNVTYSALNKINFNDYDIIVYGSDQIWNPKINSYDLVFYGDSPNSGSLKKIAYAASMEASAMSKSDEDFFRKMLQKFNKISVREEPLPQLLQPLTEKEVITVLDPTLLLTAEEWDRIAIEPTVKFNYVLAYSMGDAGNVVDAAKQIAERMSAKVVVLSSGAGFFYDKGLLYSQCASPEEFLGWFKKASFVVTSSFHGTSFAVIYGKSFYSIRKGANENTRQISLLSRLGLLDRFVSCEEMSNESLLLDKAYIETLKKLRSDSAAFLLDAFNAV